ncbi:immunity 49 family protein [Vibrio mimicus]
MGALFRFILSLFGRTNPHETTHDIDVVDKMKTVSNEPDMKKIVKTHIKNLEGEQRVYDATLESFIKTNQFSLSIAGKNCFGFETGYRDLCTLFAIGHYLPSVADSEVVEHFFSAQQYAILWLRQMNQPKGELIPFQYQGVDFAIPAQGRTEHIQSFDWLNMLYLTIITGRNEDLNLLIELLHKEQVVWRSEQNRYHLEIVLHMLGLQANGDITDLINRFIAHIQREGQTPKERIPSYHGITVTLGFFDVMQAIHQQDQVAYNLSMHRALEMHKEWWTHDKDFKTDPKGYISLHLLTAAKYAYEKYGYTLDVTSDYIPSYLYQR